MLAGPHGVVVVKVEGEKEGGNGGKRAGGEEGGAREEIAVPRRKALVQDVHFHFFYSNRCLLLDGHHAIRHPRSSATS